MSWHLSRLTTTPLTPVHQAVSLALLYSVSAALSTSAQAATMGKTVVISAQHQPLLASIAVTDVDANNFSASLANSTVYQQMGLTPTDSMSVRFIPTSASTGTVIINTTQPVSKPFADVILAIEDKGRSTVMPKTLLMPLGNSAAVKPTTQVIAAAQRPNLPVVSESTAQPLTVRRGTPPPLFVTPSARTTDVQATSQIPASKTLPQINAPVTSSIKTSPMSRTAINSGQGSNGSIDASARITNNIDSTTNPTSALQNSAAILNANQASIPSDSSKTATSIDRTDKQLDILNIQITRQIQLKNQADRSSRPLVLANNAPKLIARPNTPVDKQSSDTDTTTALATRSENVVAPNSPINTIQATSTPESTISYTVQRNDNLWVIAEQIALRNKVDVQTVMTEIQQQNPNAFIEQDANRLKANAELELPDYKSVPSQKSLQDAIIAQKQYYQQNEKSPNRQTANNPEKRPSTELEETAAPAPKSMNTSKSTAVKTANKPKTTVKTLPQAQFSVIAPGRDGSADGTQSKARAATGNAVDTDVLATLKDSRQRTANQAERLKKTNSTLSNYKQKIQLQNQKLADLEARLKKLRTQ